MTRRPKIDKSQLRYGEAMRIRDPGHLAFVAEQSCCVPGCATRPVQVHHLTCGSDPKARGVKASDLETLPICWAHHLGPCGIHAAGNERRWWHSFGVDPIALAASYVKRRGGEATEISGGRAP